MPIQFSQEGSSSTNEELLQLAGQQTDGKIRMRIEFALYVPILRSRRTRKSLRSALTRGHPTWTFRLMRGTGVNFLVPNAATVWRCIQVCVKAIREEFTIEK